MLTLTLGMQMLSCRKENVPLLLPSQGFFVIPGIQRLFDKPGCLREDIQRFKTQITVCLTFLTKCPIFSPKPTPGALSFSETSF